MNVWPGGIINKFGGLVYEKLKEKEKAGGENTSAKRFSSTSEICSFVAPFLMLWG